MSRDTVYVVPSLYIAVRGLEALSNLVRERVMLMNEILSDYNIHTDIISFIMSERTLLEFCQGYKVPVTKELDTVYCMTCRGCFVFTASRNSLCEDLVRYQHSDWWNDKDTIKVCEYPIVDTPRGGKEYREYSLQEFYNRSV